MTNMSQKTMHYKYNVESQSKFKMPIADNKCTAPVCSGPGLSLITLITAFHSFRISWKCQVHEMCSDKNICKVMGPRWKIVHHSEDNLSDIFERCKSKMLIAFNDFYAVRNKLKRRQRGCGCRYFGASAAQDIDWSCYFCLFWTQQNDVGPCMNYFPRHYI